MTFTIIVFIKESPIPFDILHLYIPSADLSISFRIKLPFFIKVLNGSDKGANSGFDPISANKILKFKT